MEMDYSKTLAVLIGSSTFDRDKDLKPIPNVKANIKALSETLKDSSVLGMPEENIHIIQDALSTDILAGLYEVAVEKVRNYEYSLIVYYSGHGLISPKKSSKLFLSAQETTQETVDFTGVPVDKFKEIIMESKAGKKIVVIDSCYSGRLIGTMDTLPSKIGSSFSAFEGTYFMASTDSFTSGRFDASNPDSLTFFTHEFVSVLKTGIPGGGPYCSMSDIFDEVKSALKEKDYPIPMHAGLEDGSRISIIKNKKYNKEENDWNSARSANSVSSYLKYLKDYPAGKYSGSAEEKLKEAEEAQLWKDATAKNTASSYYEYVKKFPQGKFIQEAQCNLDTLLEQKEEKKVVENQNIPGNKSEQSKTKKPKTSKVVPTATNETVKKVKPELKEDSWYYSVLDFLTGNTAFTVTFSIVVLVYLLIQFEVLDLNSILSSGKETEVAEINTENLYTEPGKISSGNDSTKTGVTSVSKSVVEALKLENSPGNSDGASNGIIGNGYTLVTREIRNSLGQKQKVYGLDRGDISILPPLYSEIKEIRDAVAFVRSGNKYALINLVTKKEIGGSFDEIYIRKSIVAGYTPATFFENGNQIVKVRNGDKYGCVDVSGQLKIPIEYSYIGLFKNGMAVVKKAETLGGVTYSSYTAINLTSFKVLPKSFYTLSDFSDGKAKATDYAGNLFYIDKSGNCIEGDCP